MAGSAWQERQRRELEHREQGLSSITGRFAIKDYSALECLPQKLKGKRITIYANGDMIRGGTQLPIPSSCRKWQVFLELVTRAVGMLGSCQAVYSIKGKKLHSLDQLKHGFVYVAAGNEPFKKLGYNPSAADHRSAPKLTEKAGSRSAEIDYNDRMARLHSVHTPVKIKIFTTTPSTPPVEYIVSAKDMNSFGYFLRRLSERIQLPHSTGAIRSLHDNEGTAIASCRELKTGAVYIAIGTFQASAKFIRARVKELARKELTGTELPSVGKGKPGGASGDGDVYESLRIDNVLKSRGMVLALAADKQAMAKFWKKIDGKWIDNDKNPTASLTSLVNAVSKRFPGFDLPYCWELTYAIYVKDSTDRSKSGSLGSVLQRGDLGQLLITAVHIHVAMLCMDDRGGADHVGFSFQDFEELLEGTDSKLHGRDLAAKRQIFGHVADCFPEDVDEASAPRFDVYTWFVHSEQLDRFPDTEVGDIKISEETWSFQSFEIAEPRAEANRSPTIVLPEQVVVDEFKSKKGRKAFKTRVVEFHAEEAVIRPILHSAFLADELFGLIDDNSNDVLDAHEIDSLISREFRVLNNRAALLAVCRVNNRSRVATGYKGQTADVRAHETWVTEPEFAEFLRNLFYFHKVFQLLGIRDANAGAYLTFNDYKRFQRNVVGSKMNDTSAHESFTSLIAAQTQITGDNQLLLETVCLWYAESQCPLSTLCQSSLGRPPSPLVAKKRNRQSSPIGADAEPGFSATFNAELKLLETIEMELDLDNIDIYDLLAKSFAAALSPDVVKNGIESYTGMSEDDIRAIVEKTSGFTSRQIDKFIEAHFDVAVVRNGQSGLQNLLALCATMKKIPTPILEWRQRFSFRFCVRAGRKICPAKKRATVSADMMKLAGAAADAPTDTISLDPKVFVNWCVDSLVDQHRVHLLFLDTEHAILNLGTDEALSRLLRQLDYTNTGKVNRLSEVHEVMRNKLPLMDNLDAYNMAFQHVTGRRDQPLVPVVGSNDIRDCGDTSLEHKQFRRFIFTLFCIHKVAATLQLDLEDKKGSKRRMSDYELSYGEFCLALDCLGVEPFTHRKYLGRVPAFMQLRHHRVVQFDSKQSDSDGDEDVVLCNNTIHVVTDPNDAVTFEKVISHCASKLYGAASKD